MKNIEKLTTLILLMFWSLASMAQVGIGTYSPDVNAVLDVVSATRGILFPRLTTAERNAISNPAEGLTIFNTTVNALQTNTGTTSSTSWENWYDVGAQPGSSYTGYYTGVTTGEAFSSNGNCISKIISAQGCDGLRTVTGASGTVYDLVDINGQCWMKTNLNEVSTAPIPDAPNTGSNVWLAADRPDNGYWGYYNTTDVSGAAGWGTTGVTGRGLLYQWSAAMNNSSAERAQGVCPTGFHIPSDCEWMYLEHGQGMSIFQQTRVNAWRSSTGESNKLRGEGGSGVTQWNNSSGFTALLAGDRNTPGNFINLGLGGFWWSSSESGSAGNAWARYMEGSRNAVRRSNVLKDYGFSVRCLKD